MRYDAFYPGRVWLDTEGKRIQAHGGMAAENTPSHGTLRPAGHDSLPPVEGALLHLGQRRI